MTNVRANSTTEDRRPKPPAPAPDSKLSCKPQRSSSPALPSRQLPDTGHPRPTASGCWYRIRAGAGLTPCPPGLAADPGPASFGRVAGTERSCASVPPPGAAFSPAGTPPRPGPAEPRGGSPPPNPPPTSRPAPALPPAPSGAGCPRPGDGGSSPPPSRSRGLGGQQRGRGRDRGGGRGGERRRSRPPSPSPDREAPTATPRRGQRRLSAVPAAPTAAASSAAPPGPAACHSARTKRGEEAPSPAPLRRMENSSPGPGAERAGATPC